MGLDLFDFFVASWDTWKNWDAIEFVSRVNGPYIHVPAPPNFLLQGSPFFVPFILLAVIIAVFRKKRVRKTSEDAE